MQQRRVWPDESGRVRPLRRAPLALGDKTKAFQYICVQIITMFGRDPVEMIDKIGVLHFLKHGERQADVTRRCAG